MGVVTPPHMRVVTPHIIGVVNTPIMGVVTLPPLITGVVPQGLRNSMNLKAIKKKKTRILKHIKEATKVY